MASLIPSLSRGSQNLLDFVQALSRGLSPGREAPTPDPALAQAAGPAGLGAAQSAYRQRYDAARGNAVANGVPFYALDSIAGGHAGDGYFDDLANAAQAAKQIKSQRDTDALHDRFTKMIESSKTLTQPQKDALLSAPPEIASKEFIDQTFKPGDKYKFQVMGNGTVIRYNEEDGKYDIIEDPNANSLGVGATGAGFTDGALDSLAARYRITGKLPALGNGKNVAGMKMAIINKAYEQAAAEGDTAGMMALKQNLYAGSQQAYNKILTQKTLVGSFERTAQKNLDLALNLSANLQRTNAPLLNRAFINFHKNLSDRQTSSFVNALIAARTEYAKVLSGATGATGITDQGRKEAEELFSTATSHEALVNAIGTAKQEMANRMQSFDDEASGLLPYMGGAPGGAPFGPTAPGPAAPAAPAPQAVPALTLDDLHKKYPGLKR